jgi:beta-aspartyl-peptidase (threonine type)
VTATGPGDKEIWLRTATLERPALVVHGGAGSFARAPTDRRVALEVAGLQAALAAGWRVLAAGGAAIDAVTEAVASMEADGTFNAGRGGVPTTDGTVETDASVMDGATRRAGAICAATWPDHPVHAARAVADAGDSLLLAGDGADRFAAGAGVPRRDPATLTRGGDAPVADLGTVGAVAADAAGHLAAATSTGGRPGQRPGRVGDSPILGAGTWAQDDSVAVSATGAGEAFVMAGFAHRIDWSVRAGVALDWSVRRALAAVESWGGGGGTIVIDPAGVTVVACDTPAMAYGWRSAAGEVAELRGAGREGPPAGRESLE